MSDVTGEMVTSGHDGDQSKVRIASLTERMAASPEKVGLRLRLIRLLDEAGRFDEALRLSVETAARFPANQDAQTRLQTLRARTAAIEPPREANLAPAPAPAAPVRSATEIIRQTVSNPSSPVRLGGGGGTPKPPEPSHAPQAAVRPVEAISYPAVLDAKPEPAMRRAASASPAPAPARAPLTQPPIAAEAVLAETAPLPAGLAPFQPKPERRFAAQDDLLHLARVAGGQPAQTPAPARSRLSETHPAELAPEPSVRLRLHPLARRYRAETYFATATLALVILLGVLAWRMQGSGLLVDRAAVTPLMLGSRPSAPVAEPVVTTLAPVTVPHAGGPVEAASLDARVPSVTVTGSVREPFPPSPATALPPLPERTALAQVTLEVPAGDAQAARAASDLAAGLQQAGVSVRPVSASPPGSHAGVVFFFDEDVSLARKVADLLGGKAGQVRQDALPASGAVLPGTIRITLPATRQPGPPG